MKSMPVCPECEQEMENIEYGTCPHCGEGFDQYQFKNDGGRTMKYKMETELYIIEYILGDIIKVYHKDNPTKMLLLTSVDRLVRVGRQANAKENS